MDRAVAITALVCATVAFCWLVWGLTKAGDAAVIAAAIGLVLTGAANAFVRLRNGKSQDPPS